MNFQMFKLVISLTNVYWGRSVLMVCEWFFSHSDKSGVLAGVIFLGYRFFPLYGRLVL